MDKDGHKAVWNLVVIFLSGESHTFGRAEIAVGAQCLEVRLPIVGFRSRTMLFPLQHVREINYSEVLE